MILKLFGIIMLMGVIPILLGLPWISLLQPKHQYCFAFSFGFFVELALYELVSIPIILSYGSFSTIVISYSVIILLLCGISVWYTWKNKIIAKLDTKKLFWTEWIYLTGFIFVLCLQLYRGISYDLTYMSYDDATYTVFSSDASAGNGIFTIDGFTGVGSTLIAKYVLTSWNIYPAFFASVTSVSVTTIVHTVQYIQLILLAYATYWFLIGEIVKTRENQLIFMLLVSLLYWFGYHSHYSLAFRLLGPNYQGKAVLAVSLTPLILSVLVKKLEEPYSNRTGFFLFILSIAALALTLWGTGTVTVICILIVLLSLLRKKREWKHLLYILWICVVPTIAMGYYLLDKYAV